MVFSYHIGRPTDFDKDFLNVLIHDDPHQSIQEFSSMIESEQLAIVQHLYLMGTIQKSDVGATYFEENNKNQCVKICVSCWVVIV